MTEKLNTVSIGEAARLASQRLHDQLEERGAGWGRRLYTGNILVHTAALDTPIETQDPLDVKALLKIKDFRSVAAPEVRPPGRLLHGLTNTLRGGRAEKKLDEANRVFPPGSRDIKDAQQHAASEAIQKINKDVRKGRRPITVIGPEGPRKR